jgi:hypothetical protein
MTFIVSGTAGLTFPDTTTQSTSTIATNSASVPTNGMYVPTTNNVAIATNSTLAVTFDSSQSMNLSGSYTEGVVSNGTVTTTKTLSLATGTFQTVTLTASTACTFTMPTATNGKSFILIVNQAAVTGGGTATFTSVDWGGAGTPTVTSTAGKMDIFSFVANNSKWYGTYSQGFTA